MKRLFLLFAVTILLSEPAAAQLSAVIKHAAQTMCNAVVKGDYKTAVNYMYPKMLTKLGGHDKVLQQVTDGAKQMKLAQQQLVNITIGEPGKIVNAGGQLFAMVPSNVLVDVRGKRVTTSYPQLAISDDRGKTWYFMDGGNLDDDKLRLYFPNAYQQIIAQKQAMPRPVNK